VPRAFYGIYSLNLLIVNPIGFKMPGGRGRNPLM